MNGRINARVGLSAAFVALAACSDASSGTNTPPSRTDAGDVIDAGGPDAASITPRPDLCQGLTRGGEVVREIELRGAPAPPVGGAVVPGTYDLIELDAYRGSAPDDAGADDGGENPSARPTGRAAQVTIVVAEFSMSTIEARGASPPSALGPEQAHATLYRVDGTTLFETAVCPTTALPAPSSFSATSGSLLLFPDATHRELYRRRPL